MQATCEVENEYHLERERREEKAQNDSNFMMRKVFLQVLETQA